MAGTHFGGRTLARSQALQLLFQTEATGRLVAEVLDDDYALDEGPLDEYAKTLALGADASLHELDAVIGATSSHWSLSRMPAVDRNLLRIALYEMLWVDEVDVAVAIDECVDLARAYGTDDSYRFVNGLLGKVARGMEAGEDVVADALEVMARREAAQKAAERKAEEASEGEDSEDEASADGQEQVDPVEGDSIADDLDDLPDWVRG